MFKRTLCILFRCKNIKITNKKQKTIAILHYFSYFWKINQKENNYEQ